MGVLDDGVSVERGAIVHLEKNRNSISAFLNGVFFSYFHILYAYKNVRHRPKVVIKKCHFALGFRDTKNISFLSDEFYSTRTVRFMYILLA